MTNRANGDSITTEFLQINCYSLQLAPFSSQKKMDILLNNCIISNRYVSETNKMQEFWHAQSGHRNRQG